MLHESTLSECSCGEKVRVSTITCAAPMRSKLYSMGILPGTELEVCKSSGGKGSIQIRVRGACLVLGESLAEAVTCEPVLCDKQDARLHCTHCTANKLFSPV